MLHSRARSSVPQPMASPSLAVSPAALGLPPVLEWQAQEVASFLASLKCGHLAPVFEQNDITGDVILELDMSHLKEMGVTRVGDRVRLQVGLKALRSSTFAAAASTPVTPRHSVGMRGSPSVTGIHAGVEGAVARGPSPRLEDQAGPTELLRERRPTAPVCQSLPAPEARADATAPPRLLLQGRQPRISVRHLRMTRARGPRLAARAIGRPLSTSPAPSRAILACRRSTSPALDQSSHARPRRVPSFLLLRPPFRSRPTSRDRSALCPTFRRRH
jgi:hypothetical protein